MRKAGDNRHVAFRGVDLFAGAGGLALGAKLAGVEVTHAIECNKWAAATYRVNHPSTTLFECDIQTAEPRSIPRGSASILFGGPPCQGFSTSNQRTRTASNPKNWLFGQFFRFARSMSPDWILLENVKGLRETAKGKFERLILTELHSLGYSSAVWTLGAADFGVPQKRFRLFIVGRKRGMVPAPPQPLTSPAVTVREAIADLPRLAVGTRVNVMEYNQGEVSEYARALRGGLKQCTGHLVSENNALVQARYRHIPPGGNWRNIPARLMQNYTNLRDSRSRHTGIYHRLTWDEPSVVIANYRKNMLIHPEQDRGLSVREAARLQSFPDAYQFFGSIGLQQQQVCNAVPPLLAAAVFRHITHSK
jgi:DNA (cytosine-5)-methyltransferase 1